MPEPRDRLIAQKVLLAVPIGLALWALAGFLHYLWQQAVGIPARMTLVAGLGLFYSLTLFQLAMAWFLSLRFGLRPIPPAQPGLSVDVFVPAVDEPPEMIASTLRAALEIRYPHQTYLLDDANRPELRRLAERLGAGYIARADRSDHKAGNINHALGKTDGEFVAIFDTDHAPQPRFLDRVMGLFADPEVGFVQVMNTFSNMDESVVARAAAETAFEFYNLWAVGKDRCGAASLMGSNAVIRRRALESAGLYRPGLAEDLETSLALHSRGWKSVYVREPLAPGHAPADLLSFLKQQLKWSRGIFEAALRSLGGSFFRLTLLQKLCYLTRFTYYLQGALVPVHLLLLAVLLVWPVFDVESVILRILPLTALAWISTVFLPLRMWALEPAARRGLLLRGSSLFFVSWPVYLASAVATVLRLKQRFIATPKVATHRLPLWTVGPQLAGVVLLVGAVAIRVVHWSDGAMPATVGFAVLTLAFHWILFVGLFRALQYTLRSGGRAVARGRDPELS